MVPGIVLVIVLGYLLRGLPESADGVLTVLHRGSVVAIFFLSGWTIPLHRILHSLSRWHTQTVLMCWIFLLTPLSVVALSPLLRLYLPEPLVV